MTIRTILLPVRGDGKGEVVLDHARLIASRFNTHIDVIHARAKPTDMLPFGVLTTDSMRETILEAAEAQAEAEEDRVRDLFKAYCEKNNLLVSDTAGDGSSNVSVSWHEETGKQANLIGLWGRLADLIVVPKPGKDLGINTLEAALMQTGTMTLMCTDVSPAALGESIAVAWNGKAEASSMIKSMMSLLKQAGKVSILTTDPDGTHSELGVSNLQRYLSRHGVSGAVQKVGTDKEIGMALLDAAKEAGADMLAMGAYGHSRRRELIMGGATNEVIEFAAMPVLMLH